LHGLAEAAQRRGDLEAARQLLVRILGPATSQPQQPAAASALSAFEHILGAAAVSAPPSAAEPSTADAEHWAHGDYGWLLFNKGDYQVCNSA
jgi:hypothetical protein